MIKDPVCGINLDHKSPCKSTYGGQVHAFCCPTCKTTFDKNPGPYMAAAGGGVQRDRRT